MPTLPQAYELAEKKQSRIDNFVPWTPGHSIESKSVAIQHLGSQIADFGFRAAREDDAVDLIKADAAQNKGLNEITRDLMNDNDYSTYDQRFNERAGAVTKSAADLIRNPARREKFEAMASIKAENERDKILNHGIGLRKQDQSYAVDEALNTHFGIITTPGASQEQRDEALDRIRHSIAVARMSGIVTPAQAKSMLDKYDGASREFIIKEMINNGEDLETITKKINTFGTSKTTGSDSKSVVAMIGRHETTATDPLIGVGEFSKDSKGSVSYGNLGLNSGGSAQEFVKSYGGRFGLTAAPGTDEFNRQWQEAAKADPEGLHAAEVAWFDTKIAPRIASDLTSVGVPGNIANDNKVRAYISDRMIQYGPESINVYRKRINEAAKNATSADEFIKKLGEFDAANIRTDFRSAISTVPKGEANRERYVTGLLNRVERRYQNSSTMDGATEYSGGLSPDKRAKLTAVAVGAYKEKTLEELKNAETEVRTTGIMRLDAKGRTALDRARSVLSPNQFAKEKLQILTAKGEFDATSNLPNMSTADGDELVDGLNPSLHDKAAKYPIDGINPVEHYDAAFKIHSLAEKKWQQITALRESDPAKSVNNSHEVLTVKRQAQSGTFKNYTPLMGNEMVVEARIAAQTRLGIPEYARKAITVQEAARLLPLPKNPTEDQITAAVKSASDRAHKVYGRFAKQAIDDAIRMHIRSEAFRESALDTYKAGEKKPEVQTRSWWSGFMGNGDARPVPNDAQIDWAAKDPENRREVFDRKFGVGEFSRIMIERQGGKK